MKPFRRLCAALALLSAAVSCDLIGGGDDGSTLSVTLRDETAGKEAGSVGVTVRASGAWSLELDFGSAEPWAVLSHDSGTGYKSNIKLSFEANGTGAARSVYVIVSTENDARECLFTQTPYGLAEDGGTATKSSCRWMELPETADGDGLVWGWHDMTLNGRRMRNYSFYFSTEHCLSCWVAYPLNEALMGGGSGMRSEDFRFDPLISSDFQANMSRSYSGRYDRGHQLPARDRSASQSSNSQTYYATNMTPQRSQFNQKIWAGLEETVRTWAKKLNSATDTLYVVTGCVAGNSSLYTYDCVGRKMTVPTAYYKALLRYTRSSGTYDGCAVWLDHNTSASSVTRSDMMSIDALEERLGIDLFVNLPAAVGEEKAARIEAKEPTENAWPL